MYATNVRSLARWLRVAWGLLLAATLLPGVIGSTVPAHAEESVIRDHRDPDARIWLVIRKIIVHDDLDWGDGDIRITTQVHTRGPGCRPSEGSKCDRLLVGDAIPEFHASDGETVTLNRYLPRTGDDLLDPQVTPDLGIPIHLGDTYRIVIRGTEIDAATDDQMGTVLARIVDKDGQIRFGVHTDRADSICEDRPLVADFCGPEGSNPDDQPSQPSGAFSVEYEIRLADLPDLRATDVKVYDLPGSPKKLVCTAIVNDGTADAGPFEIAVQVDGVNPPAGHASAGGLARGHSGELCAELGPLSAGQHRLTALLDTTRAVPEANDANNRFEQPYIASRVSGSESPVSRPGNGSDESDPVVTTTPANTGINPRANEAPAFTPRATPSPTAPADSVTIVGRPDLTITAIKVNGEVPDSKDDCSTGKSSKHAVTVVVKNGGLSDAPSFAVRLVADGDQSSAAEQAVQGLKVGEQREVRFGDVRLKKGAHLLVATIDPDGSIGESDEGNNGRTVTAVCKSDD